jgi:hypothetical protein
VVRVLDTSFAPEAWQTVIRDKRRPGKLVRRHLEICVFSCLADELVRGDIAAVGSASIHRRNSGVDRVVTGQMPSDLG